MTRPAGQALGCAPIRKTFQVLALWTAISIWAIGSMGCSNRQLAPELEFDEQQVQQLRDEFSQIE